MSSVTGRINEIKQPYGGYLKPSAFKTTVINDGITLNEQENLHASTIGLVIDYFTRFVMGADKREAFEISLKGAKCAEKLGSYFMDEAEALLDGITELNDESIINACKLVTFDVWYRNPIFAFGSKGYEEICPDETTIQNIHTLIQRSASFFEKYEPVTKEGFTFEPVKKNEKAYQNMLESGKGSYGGYTATVQFGDGDFLTADTLWDFKVSKSKPKSKHTLQLLMYWIMGQHSGQEIYKNITKLGIFNPRLNTVYLLDMKEVPETVIKTVEKEVICYE